MSKRQLSRPKRWAAATSAALSALEDLVALQQEYNEWYENLPENLKASALGEKLEAIQNLGLEEAKSTVEEADGIDLPRGFGRD
jgi:ribosomal protein L7/L12